jgi:hypothetical protein
MPECLQFALLNSAVTCYKNSNATLDFQPGKGFN